VGKYLREGLVAGVVAGFVAAVYLATVVQPILGEAIALEERSGHGHEPLFTRLGQQIGGAIGTLFYGVLVGLILGVVVALTRHRLLGDDRQRAMRGATASFVCVLLVPFLKYPGNPPGVGDPATVSRRAGLYLVFVALSIISAWSAWRLARTLRARGRSREVANLAGVACYIAAVALAALVLPGAGNQVGLPVELVWRFRIASLGGSALLMAVAGVVLGARLVSDQSAVVTEVDVHA